MWEYIKFKIKMYLALGLGALIGIVILAIALYIGIKYFHLN